MSDLLMPRLSDSMEEGTILSWLIEDGGPVATGQELVEIETDKATMTYESEADGALSIVAAAGSTVAVGEVIARVGPGEASPAAASVAQAAPVAEAAPIAEPLPVVAAAANGHGEPERAPATPMARRIAAVHGIALGELHGTGPRGRVVRADVMQAAGIAEVAGPASAPRAAEPSAPSSPSSASAGDGERVELSRRQTLVARRMAQAKATVPHFQVQTEVEMTAALAFRAQLQALAESIPAHPAAPSLNDLIVKACALALTRHPRANGSWADGAFQLHDHVNVGVAVAAQDALVVPVIHDADRRALGAIAEEARRLAEAVRDGTVTAAQLSGATFTVSNLGMYGMTAITPVIDPPQAAILGVGAIRDVLTRAADGAIADAKRLTLTLSADHRILYGADAARFLAEVRALLEAPAGLSL